MSNPAHLTPTLSFLRTLAEEGYWGSVTLKFERGKVVQIVRQESILPSNLTTKEQPEPYDNTRRN